MKTNKFYSILSFLMIALAITSCVEDGDYSIPDVSVTEPNITTTLTVEKIQADLIQEYNSNGELTFSYRIDEDNPTYVSGYVASSDAAGNFFKTLVIQDKAENPTAGIEVMVNESSLSQTYEIGRKVYIKLDGLSVTYDDGQFSTRINPTDAVPGKFTLGLLDREGRVDDIPSTTYRDHIVKSATVETIVPTSITIGEIEQKHINTMVKIENTQFTTGELENTFANQPNDQFDGFRDIIECGTDEIIPLQTSTFASFNSNRVPSGRGTANVILSKDFRAEFFVLIVNTPTDLDFTNSTRCDPLFEEDFGNENYDNWTVQNIIGSQEWRFNTHPANSRRPTALMSGFQSGSNENEDWIISPAIDLSAITGNVFLTFETNKRFNGNDLEVLMSTDYPGGDPNTNGTWTTLSYDIDPSGFNFNFTPSGNVDVSAAVGGNLFIAFKYTSTNSASAEIQLDNIKVAAQ